jgi:hypothetical protein
MKRWLTVLMLVVAVAPGCFHMARHCVEGSGTMGGEARSLPAIHGITLKGSATIYVTKGPQEAVRVEAEDNILPLIRTEVDNGVLVVDSRTCYTSHNKVVVRVQVPELDRAVVSGSGAILATGTFEGLDLVLVVSGSGDISVTAEVQHLESSISGSGNITVAGAAATHEARISGSGDIHAAKCRTATFSASISGSGDCTVDVSDSIDASISGSGDIAYRGEVKKIQTHIAGSGKVRREG